MKLLMVPKVHYIIIMVPASQVCTISLL